MLAWIFGGTSVGKRHFIRNTAMFPGYQPLWMYEEKLTDDDLLAAKDNTQNFLVRWQCEREHKLALIHDTAPDVQQEIVVLTAPDQTIWERSEGRENNISYNIELLRGSARAAEVCAEKVSTFYDLPIRTLHYI